jgi:dolichyl-phosphate beta-glucosyltransferase
MYLCDADLSTPIEELDKFLSYAGEYDIVIGSRAMSGSSVETSLVKKLLGRFGNLMIGVLLIHGIKDTQAGFKLFSSKTKVVFEKQTVDRWGFDFEILHLAQRLGFKIKEIPVKWINAEGSKVKPTDYFKTLGELLKIKFTKYNLDGNNQKS